MFFIGTYYCCERAVGTGQLVCSGCAIHPYPPERKATMARKPTAPAIDCTGEARPAIELQPVTSKQIKAIGYDSDSKTLAVTFTRGNNIYHYENVEPDLAHQFRTAESIGSFFGEHIGVLPSKKYSPDPVAKPDEETEAA
jgi:hypothetical protein